MKRYINSAVLAFLMIIALLVGTLAKAQGPEPGWPMHGPGDIRDIHGKNLENLRLLKMIEVLDLNDQQNPKFIDAFTSFRRTVRLINDSLQSEVDKLDSILKTDSTNNGAIKTQMVRIDDLKSRRETTIRNFHGEIAKFLTVIQMGKVTVFEERFDRSLIENLRGFRRMHMEQGNP